MKAKFHFTIVKYNKRFGCSALNYKANSFEEFIEKIKKVGFYGWYNANTSKYYIYQYRNEFGNKNNSIKNKTTLIEKHNLTFSQLAAIGE